MSAVADPNTGVAEYVHGGWIVQGGTSVSSPIMASPCMRWPVPRSPARTRTPTRTPTPPFAQRRHDRQQRLLLARLPVQRGQWLRRPDRPRHPPRRRRVHHRPGRCRVRCGDRRERRGRVRCRVVGGHPLDHDGLQRRLLADPAGRHVHADGDQVRLLHGDPVRCRRHTGPDGDGELHPLLRAARDGRRPGARRFRPRLARLLPGPGGGPAVDGRLHRPAHRPLLAVGARGRDLHRAGRADLQRLHPGLAVGHGGHVQRVPRRVHPGGPDHL